MTTESPEDRKCSASASPSPLLLPVMTTCGMGSQAALEAAVRAQQEGAWQSALAFRHGL